MKILKIEDNKGFYKSTDKGDWKPIDEIDKGDLVKLLDLYLSTDVEMDNLEEKPLSNQAQQIVYKSIFAKLDGLKENKSKFKDESDRTYLTAIEKYSKT